MIHYELIVPSARRPHLLERVLWSFMERADQPPVRVIVHDDPAFPDREAAMLDVMARFQAEHRVSTVFHLNTGSPLYHGPALHWLLGRVATPYVMYSQDDHEVIRPLPVAEALRVMDACLDVRQVRFNKRQTMLPHDRPGKVAVERAGQALVTSEHWVFQTALWRVAAIRPVVDWWATMPGTAFREHCEMKVNFVLNGQVPEFPGAPTVRVWPDPATAMTPPAREYLGTFIWGRFRDPAFVRHLGDAPEDWALPRARQGAQIRSEFPS